jgi:hypothetical protein
MTSQAAYRTGIRRIKGPHPWPEGGDLVRVSPAVRDALIRAERVEPYTRKYAKNPAAHHAWQFDAGGQGLLFSRLPDTDAPLCELGHADPGSRARALASAQVDLRAQRPYPSNMPSKFALGPCARAQDLAPIINRLDPDGSASLRRLAAKLMEEGVPTTAGSAVWTAAGVARLRARLAST